MGDPNLVTTCTFHGQEFLFRMSVLSGNLEILVTDKNSGEEWQCSYDATYIENLTQKTGNFKQFDIFVAMIKSGLLRTSESVSLDLLTFEDLQLLRSRKITKSIVSGNSNRRYLILTYVVEFDKIRYPLPLEYCGPPDPVILQATIRRLQVELAKTKEELSQRNNSNESRKIYFLQKRVDELTEENTQLQEEIRQLTYCLKKKKPKPQVLQLQKAVSNLEKSVVLERNSHHELVERLRQDKLHLARQLEKIRTSERSLKTKLNRVMSHTSRNGTGDHVTTGPEANFSNHSVRTMYKRPVAPNSLHQRSKEEVSKSNRTKTPYSKRIGSRSSSTSSAAKLLDLDSEYLSTSRHGSPSLSRRASRTKSLIRSRGCSSGNSSQASSRASSRNCSSKKQLDYKKLEAKIVDLQKMLKSNLRSDS